VLLLTTSKGKPTTSGSIIPDILDENKIRDWELLLYLGLKYLMPEYNIRQLISHLLRQY